MLWLLLLSCKGDAVDDTGAAAAVFESGAVRVEVLADGRLSLSRDGEEIFATTGPLQARTFEETVEASLGMWRFERSGEARVDLVPTGENGEAAVGLAGGGHQGLLTIDIGAESTTFTFWASDAPDGLALPVRCDADGSFHGFGAQTHVSETLGTDQRGERFTLMVSEQGIGRDGSAWAYTGDDHTSYFPMPWTLDARGHGLLVDTEYRTEVDLCASEPDTAWFEVVGDAYLQWTVMHGPTPKDVVRQLGDRVGRPALPPDWAYGVWLCMQGGEEAVREQVDLAEAAGIPATVLWVQDWTGQRENPGGGYGVQYRWNPDDGELYPDIAGFFAELKGRGYRVVGYVNPFVDPALEHWAEMEAKGLLPLDPDTGEVYTFLGPRGSMTTADLSNELTRAYIKEHLAAAVTEVGLDGWMADFAEWLPIDAVLADGSDAAAFHNRYPREWQHLTREVMDELRPDGDWLMFARSGWTGVQGSAMIHWMGDQEADWLPTDGLPTVVPLMLTVGLSGQPFVTHDIAGFSGGPSTKELYLRWTELGALSPFMRTHDGNERDENWRWDADEETTAHFVAMARLHEALAPELRALAQEAATTSVPILRHLLLEFPEDPQARAVADQFMLGSTLLAAPVFAEGARQREVYLPAGTWVDVWTGEALEGGRWITADAPLGQPPLYSLGVDRPDLRGD